MDPSLKLPEPPPELADLSTRLCTTIVNEIAVRGPLPFDRYMAMALYEPGLGYYVNGLHKFGHDGDFVTAPEQGSLFAGALAATLDEVATTFGQDWTVLEAGPGSGVLARDLLLQFDQPPRRYLLLEPSAALREVQMSTLADLPDSLKDVVEWIAEPPQTGFTGAIVANEVIDALPVSRFEVAEEGYHELAVQLDQGRLNWTRIAPGKRLLSAIGHLQTQLPEPLPKGFRSELCVDLPAWLATITRPLQAGLALMIDYGYPRAEYYRPERSDGTLVAHYRHRAHFDPFVWPGLTDLSSFVDFTALAEAALDAKLEIAGFTSQAGFILGSGIADRIGQDCSEIERLQLAGELKKLILPGEMGEKFKVMALSRDVGLTLNAFGLSDQRHRL